MRPRGPVLLGEETCTANSPKPRLSVLFTCIYVLTVTFNVSAPLRLGEGTRTGVTAQRLGGRVRGLDPGRQSWPRPHQAWPASTLQLSTRPPSGQADSQTPVANQLPHVHGRSFRVQTPGPRPKAGTEVAAPPQKVAQAEHVWGSAGGHRGESGLQPDGLLGRRSPDSPGFKSGPPASVCLSVKCRRKACLSYGSAGLGGTCVRWLACSRCSQTAHRRGFCTTRGARRSTQ